MQPNAASPPSNRGILFQPSEPKKRKKGYVPMAVKTAMAEPRECPFTILVDDQEQIPWTFLGINGDSRTKHAPWIIRTETKRLGQWKNGEYEPRGDYSIRGFEGKAHIERKSMADIQGTILEFKARNPRFERELENLQRMECSAVIVEAPFEDVIRLVPDYGGQPPEVKSKIIHRQLLSWQQDFFVPWHFCADRQHAEAVAFRILERYYEHVRTNKPIRRRSYHCSAELPGQLGSSGNRARRLAYST